MHEFIWMTWESFYAFSLIQVICVYLQKWLGPIESNEIWVKCNGLNEHLIISIFMYVIFATKPLRFLNDFS